MKTHESVTRLLAKMAAMLPFTGAFEDKLQMKLQYTWGVIVGFMGTMEEASLLAHRIIQAGFLGECSGIKIKHNVLHCFSIESKMSSFEEELKGLERDFSQLKEDYDRCIGHETLKSVMQIGEAKFSFGQNAQPYSDLLQMQSWDWRN